MSEKLMKTEANFESPDISVVAARSTVKFENEESARAWDIRDRKNSRVGPVETSIGIISFLIAADLLVVNP